MNSACMQRRHAWERNPPEAGTRCTRPDCAAVYGSRVGGATFASPKTRSLGQAPGTPGPNAVGADGGTSRSLPAPTAPVVAPPPRARPSLADSLGKMQSANGIAAPSAAALPGQVAGAPPAPPAPPPIKRWHERAGKGSVSLAFTAIDKFIDWRGKEAEVPDDDDKDRVEAGHDMAEQFSIWFPDTEVPPWGRALITVAAMGGEMYVTAVPKKSAEPSAQPSPKSSQPSAPPPPPVRVAATSASPPPPVPPVPTPAISVAAEPTDALSGEVA